MLTGADESALAATLNKQRMPASSHRLQLTMHAVIKTVSFIQAFSLIVAK
jgi:hypothetical protein